MTAIRNITDDAILQQIIDAIKIGDINKIYKSIGIMEGSFRPLLLGLSNAYELSSQWIVGEMPKYINTPNGKIAFRFNMRNPRAEEWLQTESSKLVSDITDDMRITVRNTVTAGMVEGKNPRNTALTIIGRYDRQQGKRVGGILGLTPQQEGWSRSARTRLQQAHLGGESSPAHQYLQMELRNKKFDSIVIKSIESGKPLTVEQIDKLTSNYIDNALKYRGETIARYESMSAFNAADYESLHQVLETGAVREQDIKREWDDSADNRVRHTHREMNGQTVGLNEPFVSPSEARLMYPTDSSLGAPTKEIIGCRCRVKSVINWLGEYADG